MRAQLTVEWFIPLGLMLGADVAELDYLPLIDMVRHIARQLPLEGVSRRQRPDVDRRWILRYSVTPKPTHKFAAALNDRLTALEPDPG